MKNDLWYLLIGGIPLCDATEIRVKMNNSG